MNEKKVLLFGFETLPEILAVNAALQPFGAKVVSVPKSDYHQTIGVLAGLDKRPAEVQGYKGGLLGGKMMIFCHLEKELDDILAALRKGGIGKECYKAVLTAHNRNWKAVNLFGELMRERQNLKG